LRLQGTSFLFLAAIFEYFQFEEEEEEEEAKNNGL
jgi:hypothetical protein